jgi:exodeoxyribonuclease V beta subunit
MTRPFDITAPPLPNGTLVEASAGTGKTHAVAAYVTKSLATTENLRIGEIVVTTYTRNAAAELRERIRARLIVTARILRGEDPPSGYRTDELDAEFSSKSADEKTAMARRLERAAAEFDTAMIGTIHAICSRVLRLAGVQAAEVGDSEFRGRVLYEVVNDAVVEEAIKGRVFDEGVLRGLIKTRIADPFIELHFDSRECPEDQRPLLPHLCELIAKCAQRAQERMLANPGYDDLLVRAWQEVMVQPADSNAAKQRKSAFVAMLQEKFKLAIVDEAQDTNRLQWEFFHAVFPPTGKNSLIAVGDPKQAIYSFRGADVMAYVHHAQDGVALEDGAPPKRTLSVNRRSDQPLIRGLNAAMAGAEFGKGIAYRRVGADPDRAVSQVVDLRPVEFLDVGTNLVDGAVRKVCELLTTPSFKPPGERPFKPGEICVLVRSNAVGSAVARRLSRLKIPAVTEGTASVMNGQMAADLRVLLEAMERPSDAGKARRAAATAFFGESIENVSQLGEEREQEIQAAIAGFCAVMQRKGVAAMAAEILADPVMMQRIATGDGGDRRIIDFGHVIELLNEASRGRGCDARQMLAHFVRLTTKEAQDELVSRRVESDTDSVTIMTVHAAKGLQFPCVVVVHGWGASNSASHPEVFHRDGARLMDIGKAIPNGDIGDEAKRASLAAEKEELRRLIYVAVTRPEHHVCILRKEGWETSLLGDVVRNAPRTAADISAADADSIAVRSLEDLPQASRWKPVVAAAEIATAPMPVAVEQTYRRTSYSGIAKAAAHAESSGHEVEGRGYDEDVASATQPASALDNSEPVQELIDTDDESAVSAAAAGEPDVSTFTIAPVPAGKALGSIAHTIFERLETKPGLSDADVRTEVGRVVGEVATARFLRDHVGDFAAMIADAMLTPFGGPAGNPFRDLRFADFGPGDRLAEMDFEMAVASLDSGVKARHVGVILGQFLGNDGHPLAAYAERLASEAFDVPLAGLVNGSIDAVLRLPCSTATDPRLLIADYKTNRLHERDATNPLAAYAPSKLAAAMGSHHYPLQALVYGTAVWRLLRWRLGPRKPAGWDPGECIAGVVYGFVRGMKGPNTPVDAAGSRYGVFAWQPPPGIWRRLSDLFAGNLEGVEP